MAKTGSAAASDNSNHAGELVAWLSNPVVYPHRPDRVELVETHISWVFLAGEFVYKLKKPVRFEFLDFSSVAAREIACREELRLNRRLAAGIYLDVISVSRDGQGQLTFGRSGDLIDWLVHMRRLPTERALDALHRRGELQPQHIERLAELLAAFYRGLPPERLSTEQYHDRTLAHVRGNLKELSAACHHLPESSVKRIHAAQLQLLALRRDLFDARVHEGRIIEGHGDLRPEHICLTEPPAVFDCIEFSADFRRLDVADELSFLAAECDFLGATWVGPYLLEKYRQLTGDDPAPLLVDFYKSYRACVRGKVAALRADQLSGLQREEAIAAARKHLQLAEEYLAGRQRPLVLLVGGLSGTGKTTLARALAETLGGDVLRTDVVRQELFGAAATAAEVGAGVYSADSRQRVYDELFSRAARLHAERIPVILDGTFADNDQVIAAHALASDAQSNFLAVECVCPPETALERIRRREKAGSDASQAGGDVYEWQRRAREPWPESIPQLRVDTEPPLAAQLAQVVAAIKASMGQFLHAAQCEK